jgi:hypothetical protein
MSVSSASPPPARNCRSRPQTSGAGAQTTRLPQRRATPRPGLLRTIRPRGLIPSLNRILTTACAIGSRWRRRRADRQPPLAFGQCALRAPAPSVQVAPNATRSPSQNILHPFYCFSKAKPPFLRAYSRRTRLRQHPTPAGEARETGRSVCGSLIRSMAPESRPTIEVQGGPERRPEAGGQSRFAEPHLLGWNARH